MKALIIQHFNLECYIRIKINAFGNTSSVILSQLLSNQQISN